MREIDNFFFISVYYNNVSTLLLHDLINNYPYCLPYSSYDISLENLILDAQPNRPNPDKLAPGYGIFRQGSPKWMDTEALTLRLKVRGKHFEKNFFKLSSVPLIFWCENYAYVIQTIKGVSKRFCLRCMQCRLVIWTQGLIQQHESNNFRSTCYNVIL